MNTSRASSTQPRILIIDDDPDMCVVLARVLASQAQQVRSVLTVEDAEEEIARWKPDLAIVDWTLQNRSGNTTDARELLNYMGSLVPDERPGTLVLTGTAIADLLPQVLQSGADDFAVKPLDNSNLRARISVLWAHVCARRVSLQREHRLKLALRAARDAVWDWDITSDDLYLSRRFFEILRRPEQPPRGIETWLSCVHDADRERTRGELDAFIAGLIPVFDSELRMVTGDGQTKWLLCRAHAQRDREGIAHRIVGAFTDMTDRGMADPLTGLPSRRLFHKRLISALDNLRRRETPFAVAFLDLDRFKWINDSHGHDAGDEFLRIAARRLERVVHGDGSVFRFGGDEFVVLLERLEETATRERLERIRETVAGPVELSGEQLASTVSIGFVHSTYAPETESDIVRAADTAMYLAKRRGGNQIAAHDAVVRNRERYRRALGIDLQRSVDAEQFVTHFQPIIPADEDGRFGFEALVRWHHPERGILYPGTFIELSEETGQISRIAGLVFDQILDLLTSVNRRLPRLAPRLFCSVNVSSTLFMDGRVADLLEARLHRAGVDPDQLVIELTESVLITDLDGAVDSLRRIRELGCRIALDDFGTGYSSLSHLFTLPIDHIKIDQKFVQQLPANAAASAIIRAVTDLGHALNLTVVAEGVERHEQLQAVLGHGVDFVQGFYYSQPLPPQRLDTLLDAIDAGQPLHEALREHAGRFKEAAPSEPVPDRAPWPGPVITQQRLETTAQRLSDFIHSLTGTHLRCGDLFWGPPPVESDDITAAITFDGDADGILLLSTPRPLLDSVVATVYDQSAPTELLFVDVAGEFANIVAGTATETLGLPTLSIGVPDIFTVGAPPTDLDRYRFVNLPLYWGDHHFGLSLGFTSTTRS